MSDSDIDYSGPFRVKIVQDCRHVAKKLHGCYGTCLGLYDYPDTNKKSDDRNPLILSDDGEHIWGCECWWISEEEAKASMKRLYLSDN